MIILGITGTNGAGKGAVVKYLRKNGFIHYSVRDFLIEEIKKLDMDINRTSMRIVADGLREKHGPSYIIDQILERAVEINRNCVIESIRCPGEIDSLKKNENFFLFSIDAPRCIRYERIKKRKSSTDSVNLQEFTKQEEAEWDNNEPFKMNIPKCIELSDYKFINDKEFLNLHNQIDLALTKILDN